MFPLYGTNSNLETKSNHFYIFFFFFSSPPSALAEAKEGSEKELPHRLSVAAGEEGSAEFFSFLFFYDIGWLRYTYRHIYHYRTHAICYGEMRFRVDYRTIDC